MDDVDVDEVEDINVDTQCQCINLNFIVEFDENYSYNYAQSNIVKEKFRRIIKKNKFVDAETIEDMSKSDRNKIFIGNCRMDSTISVSDFCNLFVRLFTIRECSELSHKVLVSAFDRDGTANVICTVKKDTRTNKVTNEYVDYCKHFILEGWFDFIKKVFPDINEDYARRAIVKSFALYQTEDLTLITHIDDSRWAYVDNKSGELLTDFEFFKCEKFCEGFAVVTTNNKITNLTYNYIDRNGNKLLPRDCTFARSFSDGVAVIHDFDDPNTICVIDRNGNTVLKPKNMSIEQFSEGYAVVFISNGYNYIDKKGNLLSKKHFKFAWPFREGFGMVQQDDEHLNFIRPNGQLLLNDSLFVGCLNFKNGFAVVMNGYNDYNYIKKNGQLLSKEWFNDAEDFCADGYGRVTDKLGHHNFIDRNGNLLLDRKKMTITPTNDFVEGFAQVTVKNKGSNYMDTKGNLLSDIGFKMTYPFNNGIAPVVLRGKGMQFNFINKKGNLVLTNPFEDVSEYVQRGEILISDYGDGAAIDSDGELVTLI